MMWSNALNQNREIYGESNRYELCEMRDAISALAEKIVILLTTCEYLPFRTTLIMGGKFAHFRFWSSSKHYWSSAFCKSKSWHAKRSGRPRAAYTGRRRARARQSRRPQEPRSPFFFAQTASKQSEGTTDYFIFSCLAEPCADDASLVENRRKNQYY